MHILNMLLSMYQNPQSTLTKRQSLGALGTFKTLEGTEVEKNNAAKTRGVVIQSAAGFITISGLDSTEQVDFYASDGKALGSAKAIGGTATFSAQSGSVVVAKIGKESVKIAVK